MITKCEYCGELFEENYKGVGVHKKYCCDECRREADKKNKRENYHGKRKKHCDMCGAELPKFKTRFCCMECKTRYNHIQTGKIESSEVLTKNCLVCGNEFKTWKSRKVTCSEKCKIEYRDKRLEGKVIDANISLRILAERDEQICKLCGKAVNWDDYTNDGMHKNCGNLYPSIDHIIPLSMGGLHSWGNVQLAHRICNSKKGNSIRIKTGA